MTLYSCTYFITVPIINTLFGKTERFPETVSSGRYELPSSSPIAIFILTFLPNIIHTLEIALLNELWIVLYELGMLLNFYWIDRINILTVWSETVMAYFIILSSGASWISEQTTNNLFKIGDTSTGIRSKYSRNTNLTLFRFGNLRRLF
jgi:hypothetical protein